MAGGLNLYGYADGDPVNLADPFGLNPCVVAPQMCVAALATTVNVVVQAARSPAVQQAVVRGSQLARNLISSGAIREAGTAAHHIVARGARFAADARAKLDAVGIGVNDAVNGIFLPATRSAAGPAANHLTLHTKKYYDAVNSALQNVATKQEAIEVLTSLQARLANGTFPEP